MESTRGCMAPDSPNEWRIPNGTEESNQCSARPGLVCWMRDSSALIWPAWFGSQRVEAGLGRGPRAFLSCVLHGSRLKTRTNSRAKPSWKHA